MDTAALNREEQATLESKAAKHQDAVAQCEAKGRSNDSTITPSARRIGNR